MHEAVCLLEMCVRTADRMIIVDDYHHGKVALMVEYCCHGKVALTVEYQQHVAGVVRACYSGEIAYLVDLFASELLAQLCQATFFHLANFLQ